MECLFVQIARKDRTAIVRPTLVHRVSVPGKYSRLEVPELESVEMEMKVMRCRSSGYHRNLNTAEVLELLSQLSVIISYHSTGQRNPQLR